MGLAPSLCLTGSSELATHWLDLVALHPEHLGTHPRWAFGWLRVDDHSCVPRFPYYGMRAMAAGLVGGLRVHMGQGMFCLTCENLRLAKAE